MVNRFAYTAMNNNYPGYISLNQDDAGRLWLTVRAPADPKGFCGSSATVELPREAAAAMALGLMHP